MESTLWLEFAASGLEWAGVAIIVGGALLATAKFLADLKSGERKGAYDLFRANLGRGILLGLEFGAYIFN